MKLFYTAAFSLLSTLAVAQDAIPSSIYAFKLPALNGGTIDMSAYKGKKILIVNTPENLDHHRQYSDLERLYKKYEGKLVVIGAIAPDFEIEPGSNRDLESRRKKDYRVSFPLTQKMPVREHLSPLFTWLTEKQYNHLKDNEVKWDFQKYLFDEKGTLIAIFDPKIKADNPVLVTAIEK